MHVMSLSYPGMTTVQSTFEVMPDACAGFIMSYALEICHLHDGLALSTKKNYERFDIFYFLKFCMGK